jgi:hypothetical protein
VKLQTTSPLPPFLANSVPKSGTHLLHQILNGMPGVSNDINDQGKKFFVNNPPVHFIEDHTRRLARLGPNEFGVGHLHYTDEYAGLLKQFDLKHLFIYRDPRDVLVSLSYFIPSKWGTHPHHEPFKTMTTKERLRVLIQGIPGEFPNFQTYFGPFYDWLNHKETKSIRYEELMSSDESRKRAIGKIVHFLWAGLTPPLSYEKMIESMEKNIDPAKSRTFRKGKIGTWRVEFDEEIKLAFKEIVGDMVIKTGYEKNHKW